EGLAIPSSPPARSAQPPELPPVEERTASALQISSAPPANPVSSPQPSATLPATDAPTETESVLETMDDSPVAAASLDQPSPITSSPPPETDSWISSSAAYPAAPSRQALPYAASASTVVDQPAPLTADGSEAILDEQLQRLADAAEENAKYLRQ